MTDIYKLFEDKIWKPEDYTSQVWVEEVWGMSWAGSVEDYQEGEYYSSERTRGCTEKDGYLLIELDDGCGNTYQAIFDMSKKIESWG